MGRAVKLEAAERVVPQIYAYALRTVGFEGLVKVGYTARSVVERVREQVGNITLPEGLAPYEILWQGPAVRADGTSFDDHAVHAALKRLGVERVAGEWFRCSAVEVQAAVAAVQARVAVQRGRTQSFAMRPEQRAAVAKTAAYFRQWAAEGNARTPKFLWNAKMRFGKTFATYQLAREMGFRRVLVLTFKPAVESAWQEDLETHVDFAGWQFVSRAAGEMAEPDRRRPVVCFGSFQDLLGYDRESGGIKARNEWIHTTNWDLVVFDEYHYGAWRERPKQLFEVEDEEVEKPLPSTETTLGSGVDERDLPITTRHYLYLSGTPFRALLEGDFIEEQIFGWTYGDEQQAKAKWSLDHPGEPNPYRALPQMKLLAYELPPELKRVALGGELNEFDLNAFFATEKTARNASPRFRFEREVLSFLHFLCGRYLPACGLRAGSESPPLPFCDGALLGALRHTLWYLPNVAACEAMAELIARCKLFGGYRIVVCAGSGAGIGLAALPPVKRAMGNPFETRTITLTCGKLTTGVTVRPWGGILMLRNLTRPESYFQAAFRVQSPWTAPGEDGGEAVVVKPVCYLLDFAPNRALRQVADYGCKLTLNASAPPSPEETLGDFLHFLPVLTYDGFTMKQVNAGEILDLVLSGTSATLLARRWQSALLVNVDNATLARVLANPAALAAIRKIEGFRNLGREVIETIINRSDAIKAAKREGRTRDEGLQHKLTAEEKALKKQREEVQTKLVKFSTRIPIFMYLTDDREHSLQEVIRQIEAPLFERVTGLTLADFDLLLSLGVFNAALMNEAILNFKRYEDASLSYAGIDRHAAEQSLGAWDITLPRV